MFAIIGKDYLNHGDLRNGQYLDNIYYLANTEKEIMERFKVEVSEDLYEANNLCVVDLRNPFEVLYFAEASCCIYKGSKENKKLVETLENIKID